MKRREDSHSAPRAARRALSVASILAALTLMAGCGGGGGGRGPITDTYLFAGTVPATAPTQDPLVTYSATFKDYASVAYSPDILDLVRVTVSSDVDLSFATTIEVEAQDWTFFQGRYRTIARFTGPLPVGTYAVDLPIYERDLIPYLEPFTDDLNLKVRVEGYAPGIQVHLDGDLDVYQE